MVQSRSTQAKGKNTERRNGKLTKMDSTRVRVGYGKKV